MKVKILFFLATIFITSVSEVNGQSTVFDKRVAIDEAQHQLTQSANQDGELNKFCIKNNLHGEFVVDITLEKKGKVLTVFMVSSNVEEIKYQNLLKAKLTEMQFQNIKIPKKERVKFRQTLTF